MKAKYPINSKVRYFDPYWAWRKTPKTIEMYYLRIGQVIDSREENGKIFYTLDPWVCGYYGHKAFNIPESDLDPSPELIEERRKTAPVKIEKPWNAALAK